MTALILVLTAAALAAYTDLKSRRIPNFLTGAVLVAGLALHATQGWRSLAISIALFVVVFFLGTLLFSLKLIGGGDVKLLAAAAATLGWPDTAAFLFYTVIAGGLLGIIISTARGRLRPVLANLRLMILPMLSGSRPATVPSAVGKMPYALAIFAGAATLAVAHSFGLTLRILT
jgi:prepilin peptidase CpaA